MTPLHYAVLFGGRHQQRGGHAAAVVRLLLDKGANINARSPSVFVPGAATPLEYTQAIKRNDLVALLKARGAKP